MPECSRSNCKFSHNGLEQAWSFLPVHIKSTPLFHTYEGETLCALHCPLDELPNKPLVLAKKLHFFQLCALWRDEGIVNFDFSDAHFHGDEMEEALTLSGGVCFSGIQTLNFDRSTFWKQASFEWLSPDAQKAQSLAAYYLTAQYAKFLDGISAPDIKLEELDFSHAQIYGGAKFKGAQLQKAIFDGASFGAPDLPCAEKSPLHKAIYDILGKSKYLRSDYYADFAKVIFGDGESFPAVVASFENTHFGIRSSFESALFDGKVIFTKALFDFAPHMSNAEFKSNFDLHNARFHDFSSENAADSYAGLREISRNKGDRKSGQYFSALATRASKMPPLLELNAEQRNFLLRVLTEISANGHSIPRTEAYDKFVLPKYKNQLFKPEKDVPYNTVESSVARIENRHSIALIAKNLISIKQKIVHKGLSDFMDALLIMEKQNDKTG